MTIKGSLQASIRIVKAILTRNFPSPVETWPKICVIWGKLGRNVKFCFRDPQKAHRATVPACDVSIECLDVMKNRENVI